VNATTLPEAPNAPERSPTALSQSVSTKQKVSTFDQELVISACATTTTNRIENDISPSPKDQFEFCFKLILIHGNIFKAKKLFDTSRKPYSVGRATFFSGSPANPPIWLSRH
tara:strand:+ start:268 stop:603 length:336 start_codon:yes stop_codon:yes gene_type:complete